MPDLKEKMVELLKDFFGSNYPTFVLKSIADHLIANGVTIQKWIPVSERLPEQDQEVLCYMGNFIGTLMDVYTYKGDNKWEDTYGNWNYTDIEGITHWMQLPQPPKEES